MSMFRKPLASFVSVTALLIGVQAAQAGEYPFVTERGFGDVYLDGGTPQIVDLDGDGDNDILMIGEKNNGGYSDLWWFENRDVLGTDLVGTKIDPGIDGHDYAVPVDMDGDGDLDVVSSGNSSTNGVRWYENLGEAKVWKTHIIDTERDERIAVGDVDGDGDQDIIIANYWDTGIDYYRNNGDGTFKLLPVGDLHDVPKAIVTADFDGDGDDDVLMGHPDRLVLYSYDGGPWQEKDLDPGTGVTHLRLTDIDQDGDIDVLVGMERTLVLLENLDGNFAPNQIADSGNHIIDWNADAGDVDMDGDLDIITRGLTADNDVGYFWFENDNGNFAAWHPIWLEQESSKAFDVGDLDCDGDPDLIIDYGVSGERIYINETIEADGTGVCSDPNTGGGGGDGGSGGDDQTGAGGGSSGSGNQGSGSGGSDEGGGGCSLAGDETGDLAWLLLGLPIVALRRRGRKG